MYAPSAFHSLQMDAGVTNVNHRYKWESFIFTFIAFV